MDLCLFGKDHGISVTEVASAAGLRAEVVEHTYKNIDARRRAAAYLHQPPLLVPTEGGSCVAENCGQPQGKERDSA